LSKLGPNMTRLLNAAEQVCDLKDQNEDVRLAFTFLAHNNICILPYMLQHAYAMAILSV